MAPVVSCPRVCLLKLVFLLDLDYFESISVSRRVNFFVVVVRLSNEDEELESSLFAKFLYFELF